LDARFVLELKLGQGSFGKVFLAWDMENKKKVAVKMDLLQAREAKRLRENPDGQKDKAGGSSNDEAETCRPADERTNIEVLVNTWKDRAFEEEIKIMRKLEECCHVPPYVHSSIVGTHENDETDLDGEEDGSYVGMKYMVMNLQGLSLSALKKNYLKKFSLKTVMMLGYQFVSILEDVHNLGVLHRDIKPANFIVSRANKGKKIYIVDFGLSVMWIKGNGTHIRYRDDCQRCGTARYSSINTHKRLRQSRRDDLEAAGYVLAVFLKELPWKQGKDKAADKWERILQEKLRFDPKKLCRGLPTQIGDVFNDYFNHCRNLEFSEQPNYRYLKDLFSQTLESNNEELDQDYDWLGIL